MRLSRGLAWLPLCASIVLSGCEVLPASGPTNLDMRAAREADARSEDLPFAFVEITKDIVGTLARETPRISATFANRQPPKVVRFGTGDIVGVTLFESGAGGLFIPIEAGVRPGNFITLPTQEVDDKGNITIPFAPPIPARGRTVPEIQQSILDALKDRAIDPQVIVTRLEQRASLISVLGDVNAPGRFPVNAAGERILDAIARAGGPRSQGFDSWVVLERAGKRATVPFGALVYEPSNNIYVHSNDTIYLYREPQTFVAFGASGRQAHVPFDAWRISLAEAVGKVGGLNDEKADPGAVYLYRGETRGVAELLGLDTSRFQGPIIPVIYAVNLRNPGGYFLATEFPIRNRDVIYVSHSVATESAKAMDYLRDIFATVNAPLTTATNVLIFKDLLTNPQGVVTTTSSTAIVAPQ